MVTWEEVKEMLGEKTIEEMEQNKGREYKLIDIFSKMEPNLIDVATDHDVSTIYLGLRESYEAGVEAEKAKQYGR